MSYKEKKIKDICRVIENLAVGAAKFGAEINLPEIQEDFIKASVNVAEEYKYDPMMIKSIKLNNKYMSDIVKISQDIFNLATKYEEELIK